MNYQDADLSEEDFKAFTKFLSKLKSGKQTKQESKTPNKNKTIVKKVKVLTDEKYILDKDHIYVAVWISDEDNSGEVDLSDTVLKIKLSDFSDLMKTLEKNVNKKNSSHPVSYEDMRCQAVLFNNMDMESVNICSIENN